MMRDDIICGMGIYDIPIVQLQPEFDVDLMKSNIAVFGSAMSGKTNFLQLLINNLHKNMDETTEQIFILDFGGALLEYKDLPLVAAYFDNSNEEYVKRVFRILETILKENTKKLGSANYSTYGEGRPIHTTFIIDNLNSFVDETRYTAYHEKFGRLCRDGRSKGISIVFTATDTKGISRYLLSFEQKVALCMPADKNAEIFGEKADDLGNVIGRGYANVTERPEDIIGTFNMNSPYEFQTYKAGNVADVNEEFRETLDRKFGRCESEDATEKYMRHVKRYLTFPDELTIEQFEKYKQPYEERDKVPNEYAIAVGLDYVDFKPVTVDPKESRVMAIYGKKEFGKTNLLSIIMDRLTADKQDARFVFFDDGRKQLSDLYDKAAHRVRETVIFNEFREEELTLKNGEKIRKKLSPMLQFYRYIHEQVASLGDEYSPNSGILEKVYGDRYDIPSGLVDGDAVPTVFVIQSKSVYLNSKPNSDFIHYILPELLDVAEENDYIFVFCDVMKITDSEVNAIFNSQLKTVFLLDNIAEFASERGGRTVFGDMDVKMLKEEYAKCEIGDGYAYDVEADSLKKVKFILNNN